MRRLLSLTVLVLAPLLALAGCGDDEEPVQTADGGPSPAGSPAGSPVGDDATVYEATTTVLESPDHGPQLCLGGQQDSYPPQCGGPDVTNWDWDAVEHESANGTRWGTFHVVGTYDGTFTLTEDPGAPRYDDAEDFDFSSPCPEPEGGWVVVDPATATDEAQGAAFAYADAQPEYAGGWVDQSINPASESDDPAVIEGAMNDPTKLVLNLRFTDRLAEHEAAVREIWGGALCVSEATHTEAELRAIQDELSSLDGFLSSSTDVVRGRVDVGVIVADPAQQAALDEEYGEGVVELTGALRPVSP